MSEHSRSYSPVLEGGWRNQRSTIIHEITQDPEQFNHTLFSAYLRHLFHLYLNSSTSSLLLFFVSYLFVCHPKSGTVFLGTLYSSFFFFFWLHHVSFQDPSFPDQGSNPGLWQWKHWVLTTELTGNSHFHLYWAYSKLTQLRETFIEGLFCAELRH